MKSISTAIAAAAATILASSSAQAVTFYLNFSDAAQSTSGSLTLTAIPDGPNAYLVTLATGTIDGFAASLEPTGSLGLNDNVIYSPPGTLDDGGLTFSADGFDYNVYVNDVGELYCNGPGCFGFGGLPTDSLTISTPEPAAWALMLAGFAGLGAMLRTRRPRRAAQVRA